MLSPVCAMVWYAPLVPGFNRVASSTLGPGVWSGIFSTFLKTRNKSPIPSLCHLKRIQWKIRSLILREKELRIYRIFRSTGKKKTDTSSTDEKERRYNFSRQNELNFLKGSKTFIARSVKVTSQFLRKSIIWQFNRQKSLAGEKRQLRRRQTT